MKRTYLDLSINERINLKSWWVALPLAYFFKNGILKRDADIMFFNGYRTSMEQMSEPNPKPLYKGMSAEGKGFMKSWEQLVKFGGICR